MAWVDAECCGQQGKCHPTRPPHPHKKKKLAPTARRSKRIAGVLEQRMMVEPLVPDQLQCWCTSVQVQPEQKSAWPVSKQATTSITCKEMSSPFFFEKIPWNPCWRSWLRAHMVTALLGHARVARPFVCLGNTAKEMCRSSSGKCFDEEKNY